MSARDVSLLWTSWRPRLRPLVGVEKLSFRWARFVEGGTLGPLAATIAGRAARRGLPPVCGGQRGTIF